MGLQIIVVPWLALDALKLSPSAVGIVQAGVLIPNALLLIIGGISADRGTLLRKFLYVLMVYSLVHAYLFFLVTQHYLSFISLLLYALMLGGVAAFLQPYKDYLLGTLAGGNLQLFIAKNNICQYLGQAVGIGIASPLYLWQLESLPILQMLLISVTLACFYGLYTRYQPLLEVMDNTNKKEPFSIELLFSGFRCCWQSPILRSLIAIVAVNGFFHVGIFIVALPVLAKKVYVGNIGLYSLLQCLFVFGTVAAMILVIVKGQLDAPGRRVIFSVLYAGLILLGLSMGPTLNGLMFLIFLWGVVVGISATLGRGILHSQVLAEYRGRAISVYQLALFGCAPLGSLFAGVVIEYWDVLYLLKFSAIASFIAFAGIFLTRELWDVEAEQTTSTKK